MEFKVGDKAVFPAHGVGVIKSVESREIGGSKQDFYVLHIISSGARLMVPVAGCSRSGMRNLVSDEGIKSIYNILKTRRKNQSDHLESALSGIQRQAAHGSGQRCGRSLS